MERETYIRYTAEITSIEAVFPEMHIFLCDFHWDQSSNRWALGKSIYMMETDFI